MSCTKEPSLKKRICLVGAACDNLALAIAAQQFNVPVMMVAKSVEYVDNTTYNTYFILNSFEGCDYDTLSKISNSSILGPTALLQLAKKTNSLPILTQPLYTTAMLDTVVVFNGFRTRQNELSNLVNLILAMGGTVRKEMDIEVTHLISTHIRGEKYRCAEIFDLPIMSPNWVLALWDTKDNIGIFADNEELIATYKLRLYGTKICFFNFSEEEKKHMCDFLKGQAGKSTEIDDPNCTHVVVNESNVDVLPNLSLVSASAYIVKTEWFWISVQNEAAADEKEFLFEHYLENSNKHDSQQIVTTNTALRKQHYELTDPTSNLLLRNERDSPADLDSSLEITALSDLTNDVVEIEVDIPSSEENLSQRQRVFYELLQTEYNYVGILDIIMTLFKLPLENFIGKSSEELLNRTEAKIIFGNIPPIYDVHKQLLKALHYCANNWTEDTSIGKIILKFESDLIKAYPPYVNFFEDTKQMLKKCDQNKPRFHVFLENCQKMPKCGRQSLKELLIKPVQRLPSIRLLLNAILKHTNSDHSDYNALEASIDCIKKVMTYVNEDKRKTERHLEMFDIFNEIDNCPPCLISSDRSLITKCDVIELTKDVSESGDRLVLFLFNDTLAICKKRSKAVNKSKSSGILHLQGKLYKHLKILSLDNIRKVIDIRVNKKESHKIFSILIRDAQEPKERTLSFLITDKKVNKAAYLRILVNQIAIFMQTVDPTELLTRHDINRFEGCAIC